MKEFILEVLPMGYVDYRNLTDLKVFWAGFHNVPKWLQNESELILLFVFLLNTDDNISKIFSLAGASGTFHDLLYTPRERKFQSRATSEPTETQFNTCGPVL